MKAQRLRSFLRVLVEKFAGDLIKLFTGETAKGLELLLCERPSGQFPSPNCLAIDRPLARTVSFSYRFKRAYLARWREISAGVEKLIGKFRDT